jgi:hypothetical protein
LPQKPVAAEALRRAALARDLQALGTPLAAQVATRAAAEGRKLRPHLAGLALACSAMVLALVGASLPVVALAAAALYVAGYAVAQAYARQRRADRIAPAVELAARFDEFVAEHIPRLPAEANASLQRIKTLLSRVLPVLGDPGASAALTQEEAFFAREAVARYLPDAVRPLLQIPPERAGVAAGSDARTPRTLLVEQLGMVERELARIDERLAAGRAGELARNRELLERRTSR